MAYRAMINTVNAVITKLIRTSPVSGGEAAMNITVNVVNTVAAHINRVLHE